MKARKVTAFAALLIVPVSLALYAYDIERNLAARDTLTKACRELREYREAQLPEELLATLFEHDAPFVLSAIRESVDRPCDETTTRLTFWRWNLGVRYGLARDPARAARLATALGRADVRCPAIMMQAFEELPGHVDPTRSARAAARACAPFGPLAHTLSFIPTERLTAWQWASRLAAVARSLEAPQHPRRRPGQEARAPQER